MSKATNRIAVLCLIWAGAAPAMAGSEAAGTRTAESGARAVAACPQKVGYTGTQGPGGCTYVKTVLEPAKASSTLDEAGPVVLPKKGGGAVLLELDCKKLQSELALKAATYDQCFAAKNQKVKCLKPEWSPTYDKCKAKTGSGNMPWWDRFKYCYWGDMGDSAASHCMQGVNYTSVF